MKQHSKAVNIVQGVMLLLGVFGFAAGWNADRLMRFEYSGGRIIMHSPLRVLSLLGLVMMAAALEGFVFCVASAKRANALRPFSVLMSQAAFIIMLAGGAVLWLHAGKQSLRYYGDGKCAEYTDSGRTVVLCAPVYSGYDKGMGVTEAFQIDGRKARRLGVLHIDHGFERIELEWKRDSLIVSYPVYPTGDIESREFDLK